MYLHVLDVRQGTRAKGDGKAIYTIATTPISVYFRPAATRTEMTSAGLVKTQYIPAICYDSVKVGDCLGTVIDRKYKITAVNEIPMSDGQRQLELKAL